MKTAKDKPAVRLWLDSGAFSVWQARQSGKDIEPILVGEYVDYLQSVEKMVECYITLDEIPLKPRTRDELVRSARTSYERHQRMKRAGLRPMPVFHQGERFSWLERYIADGESYIGLSGLKGLGSSKSVKRWCDVIFTHYTDAEGRPLVKFHGLGLSHPELLQRYPWFSVDSTTWAKKSGYGSILVPAFRDGRPDFLEPPKIVPVSGIHKSRKQFERLSDERAAPVLQWLAYLGTDITRVRNLPDERRLAMLKFYEGLRQQLWDVRFTHKLPGCIPLRIPSGLQPLEPWTLRIVHATNTSRTWCVMMSETCCMDRLLSYADLRDSKPNTLEDYVLLRGQFAGAPDYNPTPNWKAAYRSHRAMCLIERVAAQ